MGGEEKRDKGIKKHMLSGMVEWVANAKTLVAGSIAFSYRCNKKHGLVVKNNRTAFGMSTDSITIILMPKLNAGIIIKFYKISKLYRPQQHYLKKSC